MTHQTFFEHTVLERHLRNDFFELAILGPQVFHLGACRLPHRVAAQLLFSGLEEVLALAIVQIHGNPFASAQLGHADLAAYAVEHDPDLLLRGKPPARLTTDVTHGGLTRLCLSSWHETLLSRAFALGKVSLNSEPFCIRVQLTGYIAGLIRVDRWDLDLATLGVIPFDGSIRARLIPV